MSAGGRVWLSRRASAGACLLSLLFACSGSCGVNDAPADSAKPTPSGKSTHTQSSSPPLRAAGNRSAATAWPALRLRAGTLQAESDSVHIRSDPPKDTWLYVQAEAVRFSSDDGSILVRALPASVLRLGSHAPLEIFCARGAFSVSVSPRGGSALPSVRVVLAGRTVVIPATGHGTFGVNEMGDAFLAMVGGHAELWRSASASTEATVRPLRPADGPVVWSSRGEVRPAHPSGAPPATESEAQAMLQTWLSVAAAVPEAQRDPAVPLGARGCFAAALSDLDPQLPAGAELAKAHASLMARAQRRDPSEQAAVRRAAVAFSQRRATYRRDLLLAWEAVVSCAGPGAKEDALRAAGPVRDLLGVE